MSSTTATKAAAFVPSPEQAAVLDAPTDADVLVVAGAGSGKTFTMTQRIIRLIERGVAPERILGLTFTRKAASELLSRVSAAVAGSVLKPEVSTYDAFFQSIVRQYGLLVGFDRNTQPLSEAGAFQLASEVIGERFDLVRAARAEGLDMGAFPSLVGDVLALSDAIGGAMIGNGCTTVEQAIGRVRDWDRAFLDRLDRAIGDEPVPEERPKPPARPRGKKDLDRRLAQWREDCLAALHLTCVYTADQLRRTVCRREVLLSLAEAYREAKRRRNMAEFSDFTIAAFQLVTRFPSIGEECRRRYTHVLLDEYQDTSTTQAMLLAALFHRGTAMGERSAVSAVGDPFQSIYAWRGASPGAFRMFQRDFGMDTAASVSSQPYALSVTRRNARIVLDAANALTLPLRRTPRRPGSSLMREVDVPPLSSLEGKPNGTLGLLGYQTLGQEIDGVTRFVKAAASIWRAAAEREAAAKGTTASPAPRVAVLFRSKTGMPAFRDALEAAGLRVLTVGHSALLERPDVRDLLAMLHVAGDHTDAASLMRLLATPRYALSAGDLTALADLAEQLNVEYRYRALAQAGLADPDAPRRTWAATVREHRNEVANAVFLPDLLLRDDLADLLARSASVSAAGSNAVLRASEALRRVRRAVGRPLTDVVRTAAEALGLDVDTVLAQAVMRPGSTVLPAQAHAPFEQVIALVDTYAQEIVGDGVPSLPGFMAWVDSLRAVPEESQGMPDEPADVVFMTIHQSKGLEWDAVAVVGMGRGSFPSSQGDHLRIDPDPDHPGHAGSGDDPAGSGYEPPEYRESARTWLMNPAAVPVPMRVDAGILPRFPHDAASGSDADPLAALEALDDVETIDDEAFGSMRAVAGLSGDGEDADDRDAWYLTQSEEYGRRLHADERRLAYVALTRARTDALLTFSASGSLSRDPDADGPAKPLDADAKASNFWLETRDALAGRSDRVDAGASLGGGGDAEAGADADAGTGGDAAGTERPDLPAGFFVGDAARAYEECVVGSAWREPVDGPSGAASLPWPGSLSERMGGILRSGADLVRATMAQESSPRTPEGDGDDDDGGTDEAGAGAQDGSLFELARTLCDDRDLMGDLLAAGAPAAELDAAVKAKATRITASGRRSVTAMQALGGHLTAREARDYWRGIVRPIPRVASPNAAAGTVFHAWAERFLNARLNPERPDVPAPAPQDEQLGVWQRRLMDSPWARRMPVWAERQIVVSVPELGGAIINGKLDAVFAGGLGESASRGDLHGDGAPAPVRYTVIDWKTGRRPRTAEDTARKLAQLDLYRLLLARMEGLPVEAINAALYYVSEADPARRLIAAEPKSLGEILDRLRVAVPEGSDTD